MISEFSGSIRLNLRCWVIRDMSDDIPGVESWETARATDANCVNVENRPSNLQILCVWNLFVTRFPKRISSATTHLSEVCEIHIGQDAFRSTDRPAFESCAWFGCLFFCRSGRVHLSSASLGYQTVWLWSDVRSWIVYRAHDNWLNTCVRRILCVCNMIPLCDTYWHSPGTYDQPYYACAFVVSKIVMKREHLCYQKRLWLWLTIANRWLLHQCVFTCPWECG